jgi:nuclear mRNA export protein PCID2/THP1
MFFRWMDMQFDPNRGSFDENLFPMSWRVMLSYLKGRQSIYDNDYVRARDHLRFAFSNSHPENPRNKKKILKFLVLVEINLNVFPTKALLQKYQLTEYIDLVESCQAGDMTKFEECLNKHMDYFIYGGVYLVVEKLRHLTIRNLMKKVAMVFQKEKSV